MTPVAQKFTVQNTVENPLPETDDSLLDRKPNTKPMYSNMFTEAKLLQALILRDAQQEDLKPFIRAQLVRAYKELAELRLRLQGKGPPKAVDYTAKAKRKPAARGFSETPADKPAVQDKPAE